MASAGLDPITAGQAPALPLDVGPPPSRARRLRPTASLIRQRRRVQPVAPMPPHRAGFAAAPRADLAGSPAIGWQRPLGHGAVCRRSFRRAAIRGADRASAGRLRGRGNRHIPRQFGNGGAAAAARQLAPGAGNRAGLGSVVDGGHAAVGLDRRCGAGLPARTPCSCWSSALRRWPSLPACAGCGAARPARRRTSPGLAPSAESRIVRDPRGRPSRPAPRHGASPAWACCNCVGLVARVATIRHHHRRTTGADYCDATSRAVSTSSGI